MNPTLPKVDGPSCPGCGCRDGWNLTTGQRQCRHCGRAFTPCAEMGTTPETWFGGKPAVDRVADVEHAPAKAITYPTPEMHCPECGSLAVRVYTTRPPVRYLKCKDCDHRFKAVKA